MRFVAPVRTALLPVRSASRPTLTLRAWRATLPVVSPRNRDRGSLPSRKLDGPSGRFLFRLELARIPPTSRNASCRDPVRLSSAEPSHRTLSPVCNQVATDNWVRSGTILTTDRALPCAWLFGPRAQGQCPVLLQCHVPGPPGIGFVRHQQARMYRR